MGDTTQGTVTVSGDGSTSKRGRQWPEALGALASEDFRRLVQATFISSFALAMQTTVLGWLILERSNSPFYLGLNGFFHMIPALVVTHYGGIVADRFSRKGVLVIGQASLAMVAVALALLVFLKISSVWPLMMISLLSGAFNTFMHPARAALVGEFVSKRQMTSGVSLHTIAMSLPSMTAPALAGWIIGAVSLVGSIIVQAVFSVASFATVLTITVIRRAPVGAGEPYLCSLIDGWRYCYKTNLVFTVLMTTSIYTIFTMPSYVILLPDYARGTLGQGVEGLGLLLSSVGAGVIVGSILMTITRKLQNRRLIALGAVAFAGVLLNLLAVIQSIAPAMLVLGGLGACFSIVMILTQSIVLEYVPDEMRGRAISAYMFTGGLFPFGSLALGTIAGSLGTPIAMTVGGVVSVALAATIFITRPDIRRI